MTKLVLNEIFGPTIQGEGPHMGRNALFLRTFGCPLGCTFCDTPYSWRTSISRSHDKPEVYDPKDESWQEFPEVIIDQLERKWQQTHFNLLVITGGEPLIQQEKLEELLNWSRLWTQVNIDIETAGFIKPVTDLYTHDFISFNVSVKLSNSKVEYDKRTNPQAINMFIHHPRAIFKFVVDNETNIEEIVHLRDKMHIPNEKIWLMPQCLTREEHLAKQDWVIQQALKYNWNFSPRLHVLLWGNKRGV